MSEDRNAATSQKTEAVERIKNGDILHAGTGAHARKVIFEWGEGLVAQSDDGEEWQEPRTYEMLDECLSNRYVGVEWR